MYRLILPNTASVIGGSGYTFVQDIIDVSERAAAG